MRNIHRVAAVIVLLLAAMSVAETTQTAGGIKDAAAKTALSECDAKIAAAKVIYCKAMAEAKQALVPKLEAALAAETKSGNLEEAIKIKDLIKDIKIEIAELQGGKDVRTVQVFAVKDWTPYGKVEKGQIIRFSASGDWWMGPTRVPKWHTYADGKKVDGEGVVNEGVLKGRIGKQEFTIGLGTSITVEETGALELRSSDGNPGDNSGLVTVKIELLAN